MLISTLNHFDIPKISILIINILQKEIVVNNFYHQIHGNYRIKKLFLSRFNLGKKCQTLITVIGKCPSKRAGV